MFAKALEPLGLRPPHFGVMQLIASDPGITQQELADRSLIDASSMVAVVDELEEFGFAERRPHPGDRRKHSVHLTADGKRTLERARTVAGKLAQDILAPLEGGEVATLTRLLRKLAGVENP
jgi:MarR family transcriptional regulator, lower aerobic nicotinate degradation pathway regulator